MLGSIKDVHCSGNTAILHALTAKDTAISHGLRPSLEKHPIDYPAFDGRPSFLDSINKIIINNNNGTHDFNVIYSIKSWNARWRFG